MIWQEREKETQNKGSICDRYIKGTSQKLEYHEKVRLSEIFQALFIDTDDYRIKIMKNQSSVSE